MSDELLRRIDRHEDEIKALTQGQRDIENKLDAVLSGLTELRAQRGPGLMGVLNAVQAIFTICTIAIGGIVYFASNGLSKEQHASDVRMIRVEDALAHHKDDIKRINEALGWRPTIARSP